MQPEARFEEVTAASDGRLLQASPWPMKNMVTSMTASISMSATSRLTPFPLDRTGLVMTAGGARGAYQAGVLKRIGEIPALRQYASPFEIIAGASAGAINGASIAGFSEDLKYGSARLASLWGRLDAAQIYRTDVPALLQSAARIASRATIGHWTSARHITSFLDAAPLRRLLHQDLPLTGIDESIAQGRLYALAITATGYGSGKSYTFVQGQDGLPLWDKTRKIALSTKITVDHVCASAAIPMIFPPIALDTGGAVAWFGDGALRLTTPLSPAIHLGADRILAIGIRCRETVQRRAVAELTGGAGTPGGEPRPPPPSLTQISGMSINALFLDHLDADLGHLMRMNAQLSAYQRNCDPDAQPLDAREPMRVIPPLTISPSEDLAEIAHAYQHRMPKVVRLILDTLGSSGAQGSDLTSYLLFDGEYTRALVDLGYRDAGARCDEIEAFLFDSKGTPSHQEPKRARD